MTTGAVKGEIVLTMNNYLNIALLILPSSSLLLLLLLLLNLLSKTLSCNRRKKITMINYNQQLREVDF